jgi:hypothetical protein
VKVLRKPGPAWFEGPQYWRSNILFSDTINDRIYKSVLPPHLYPQHLPCCDFTHKHRVGTTVE